MDQCTNWNELREGIKATQSPTLSILYPTHAQFEGYDEIAVYSKDNKMVIYGYQLKEGKATSNQPVHSSFAKSFVVKGASTKTFKMSDAWCIPGTKEIDSFFGPCGVHWTPQAWATLLKKNLKKNVWAISEFHGETHSVWAKGKSWFEYRVTMNRIPGSTVLDRVYEMIQLDVLF